MEACNVQYISMPECGALLPLGSELRNAASIVIVSGGGASGVSGASRSMVSSLQRRRPYREKLELVNDDVL